MSASKNICPELPAFKWADLDSVIQAFHEAPVCILRQSWRSEPDREFLPAFVRMGWQEQTILVLAELKDAEIFTFARHSNERLWELGDVFEVFLRPLNQSAYTEIHLSPNNLRMGLRFGDAAAAEKARKNNSFSLHLIPDMVCTTRTWVFQDFCRWYALFKIPVGSVCDQPMPLPGSEWLFSFCRYDYSRGHAEPVISSTSAHASANDFHRQADWGTMRCESRLPARETLDAATPTCGTDSFK
jgi:hypothetical protein